MLFSEELSQEGDSSATDSKDISKQIHDLLAAHAGSSTFFPWGLRPPRPSFSRPSALPNGPGTNLWVQTAQGLDLYAQTAQGRIYGPERPSILDPAYSRQATGSCICRQLAAVSILNLNLCWHRARHCVLGWAGDLLSQILTCTSFVTPLPVRSNSTLTQLRC